MSAPQPATILLVDDDAAVARAMKMVLTRAGFTVSTASAACEAEVLLDGGRFDALILDLRMPHTNGVDLYESAVARQPWLSGSAIFVSGDGSVEAEEHVEATGCRLFLKPFATDQLLEELRRLTRRPTAAA